MYYLISFVATPCCGLLAEATTVRFQCLLTTPAPRGLFPTSLPLTGTENEFNNKIIYPKL